MARPIVENENKTPTQLYLTPAEREAFPRKATTKYRNRIARTKPHKDFPTSIVPSPCSTSAFANGIYHRSMPDRRRREHSFPRRYSLPCPFTWLCCCRCLSCSCCSLAWCRP